MGNKWEKEPGKSAKKLIGSIGSNSKWYKETYVEYNDESLKQEVEIGSGKVYVNKHVIWNGLNLIGK